MNYTYNIPGLYANDRHTPTKADQIFDGLSAGKVKEEVQALIRDEETARRHDRLMHRHRLGGGRPPPRQ